MSYSKIKELTIQNFMSIEKAVLTFDDKNILTIKGYNDSGKSAVLKALRVLLEDWNRTKQRKYIKDGKEYFRITATFTDGVKLIRDKYRNGQSLYEMHKDGKCLYTNKSGRKLTNVKEMPEIIEKYINIPIYNGRALNAQSCNELYLLVETKGSDNYKMLGEASDDGTLLRSVMHVKEDKKNNQAEIMDIEAEIGQCDAVINSTGVFDKEIVDRLKEENQKSENTEVQKQIIDSIIDCIDDLNKISVPPEVEPLKNVEQITDLEGIDKLLKELDEPSIPEIEPLKNIGRLEDITYILGLINQLEKTPSIPYIESMNIKQTEDVEEMLQLLDEYNNVSRVIQKYNNASAIAENQAETLTKECLNLGIRVVDCPKCGYVHAIDLHDRGF